MASTHIGRPQKAHTSRYKLQKRSQQLVSASETHQGYYEANTQPSYSMFGMPDFVDEEGREYRLAFALRDSTERSPIYGMIRLRAHEDGTHVNANLDDYIQYVSYQARERHEHVQLMPVHPGATGRTRMWIRLPMKRRDPALGTLKWPETSHELGTRLTYVGDPSLAQANETLVIDVVIQATMRMSPARKTGYVDVAGMDSEIASILLQRRLSRLVVSEQ
jgi:hypothetical protein